MAKKLKCRECGLLLRKKFTEECGYVVMVCKNGHVFDYYNWKVKDA